MEDINNGKMIVNSIIFALIGMGVFGLGFWLFDKLTPFHLWKQLIEEKNLALAVVVGAVALGISLIISAAIHG